MSTTSLPTSFNSYNKHYRKSYIERDTSIETELAKVRLKIRNLQKILNKEKFNNRINRLFRSTAGYSTSMLGNMVVSGNTLHHEMIHYYLDNIIDYRKKLVFTI